jgi:hypothetical protein
MLRSVRSWIAAIVSVLGVALGAADSHARCLRYEPAQVTVAGVLVSRSLPGPPNYKSIAHGDYPQTFYFLQLNEPICVSADPSSRANRKTHTRITELQLLLRDLDPVRFVGKPVRASGSLSSAHMAYHRTPVVLTVASLRAG